MWNNTDPEESFRNKVIWWSAGIVVAALIGFGAYYRYHPQPQPPAQPAQTQAPLPAAPAPAAAPPPAIEHPIPTQSTPAGPAPLPALDASDPTMISALDKLIGHPAVVRLLVPKNVIRRIVVTIDNLPRAKVAADLRPVKPTPGSTVVAQQGPVTVLSQRNYARYAPFVKAVGAIDVKSLATLYFRLYPLFQQAYESLGYPGKYFNDRLVEAIDSMLATPTVTEPITLVRPKVFYQFADPKLESLPAGQKLLIRMGPDNAAVIESKLRQFRALIVKPPK